MVVGQGLRHQHSVVPGGVMEAPKTGERRKGSTQAPKRALHVGEAPCPKRQGTHELVNTNKYGVTCIYCGGTWADLDMELNGPRA